MHGKGVIKRLGEICFEMNTGILQGGQNEVADTKAELMMDGLYFLYKFLKNTKDKFFELVIGQFGKGTCLTLAGNHENSIGCEIEKVFLKAPNKT